MPTLWIDSFVLHQALAAPTAGVAELAKSQALLCKLESMQLTQAEAVGYGILVQKLFYREEGGGACRAQPVPRQLLAVMPAVLRQEALADCRKFLEMLRHRVRYDVALAAGCCGQPAPFQTVSGPRLTACHTLAGLASEWGAYSVLSTVEWSALINAMTALYPNVPSDIVKRWHEFEQGQCLGKRIEAWHSAHIVRSTLSKAACETVDMDGYAKGEHLAPPCSQMPTDATTWSRVPLIELSPSGLRLLHGIESFKELSHLPTRLKRRETHDVWLLLTDGISAAQRHPGGSAF